MYYFVQQPDILWPLLNLLNIIGLSRSCVLTRNKLNTSISIAIVERVIVVIVGSFFWWSLETHRRPVSLQCRRYGSRLRWYLLANERHRRRSDGKPECEPHGTIRDPPSPSLSSSPPPLRQGCSKEAPEKSKRRAIARLRWGDRLRRLHRSDSELVIKDMQ